MLGFGDKAVEFFNMINPIEHSKTKTTSMKYKVEPYIIPADIYGAGNLAGRGGWTWYTGSSSWMYIAGLKYILGLDIENGVLKINPQVSSQWKEYEIKFKYGDGIYNIKVINENGKSNGIEQFIVNGINIPEKQIKIENGSNIYEIEIII